MNQVGYLYIALLAQFSVIIGHCAPVDESVVDSYLEIAPMTVTQAKLSYNNWAIPEYNASKVEPEEINAYKTSALKVITGWRCPFIGTITRNTRVTQWECDVRNNVCVFYTKSWTNNLVCDYDELDQEKLIQLDRNSIEFQNEISKICRCKLITSFKIGIYIPVLLVLGVIVAVCIVCCAIGCQKKSERTAFRCTITRENPAAGATVPVPSKTEAPPAYQK